MEIHGILAAVTWQDVGMAFVAVLTTVTGGAVASDKIKARRNRTMDAADRVEAAVVSATECDRRHGDLDRLIQEQNRGLERVIDEKNRGVERLIDEKHSGLKAAIEQKIEGVEKRFDDLKCDINKGFDRMQRSIEGEG